MSNKIHYQAEIAKTSEQLFEEAQERKHKFEELSENSEIGLYLKQVPLLAKLSETERNKLGSLLVIKKFADKENIIKQGDLGHEFYIIKHGNAVVILEDKETKSSNEIAELKTGDYFGEQALLNESKRAATVQARGDVECFTLDSVSFNSLFSKKKLNVQFAKRRAVTDGKFSSEGTAETEKSKRDLTKTSEDLEFIKKCLKDHVLFQGIDAHHREDVLKMMWKENVKAGTTLIKQGERGDFFYLIQQGEFEVFIRKQEEYEKEAKEIKVNHLGPGKGFGELALMYNSPRAATVKALKSAVVWVLDRRSFRAAVRQANRNVYSEWQKFIDSVEILQPLLSSERARVAEALEEFTFKDSEVIMREGDEGDGFFIVLSGEVIVVKKIDGIPKEVHRCKKGDYFGERALLKKEPRAASCIAKGTVECLRLSTADFEQLLGPIQDILASRWNKDNKSGELPDESSTVQLPPSESSLLPIKKEDLEIIGTLGRGSFGVVQLVRDKKSGNTYALKRLSKAHLVGIGQHLHVSNEKTVMIQLNHPFTVKLRATYKDKDCLYFLMDACLGGDLFTLLRSQTLFEERVARFYAATIILAFEHMHEKDIIHRDLKPENVLIDSDGYPKLTDFGFAKVCKDRTWTLCGTPDYLAPEVIQGRGHGKAVDWWTLGILIFEMLASYPPFYDEDPMMTYAKIARGKVSYPKHFSRRAVDLIKRLLHPRPINRLGVIKGGASLIKRHPWFDGFDWDALVKRQLPAPFLPEISGDADLSNFVNTGSYDDDGIEPFNEDSSAWDTDF